MFSWQPKVSVLFVFILAATSSADDIDVRVVGKLGDASYQILTSTKRDIELVCDLGVLTPGNSTTQPQWSWIRNNSQISLTSFCTVNENSNQNKTFDGLKCKIERDLKKDGNTHSTLKLDDIAATQFGEYVCHKGDDLRTNLTFKMQELPTLLRRSEKGKVQTSVTLFEDQMLYLYCNSTGLNDDCHRISWWKDGQNITDDLMTGERLFQNFTQELNNPLAYEGIALMEHRGNYTCQVDLKSNETCEIELNPGYVSHFPMKFKFFVRVKASDSWKLPVYVLMGEVGLIGLFTIILNRREKALEEADVQFDDSDDEEDDVLKAKNAAVINNNSGSG